MPGGQKISLKLILLNAKLI